MLPSATNAGERLLHALLAAFNSGAEDVTRLFAEQAVIEFPYAASVGTPGRLSLTEYGNYLAQVLPTMPRLRFSDVRVYPLQAPGEYFAEMHAATTAPGTGRPYEQDYVLRFTMADDRFTHYREYWNPLPWLRAFADEQALRVALAPASA